MEKAELIRRLLPTAALACLCVIAQLTMEVQEVWYFPLYYHFLHANVWHFLVNFSVMARFMPRWTSIPAAYLSASAASFMGFTGHSVPVVGMSAVMFAMLARRDAILGVNNWTLLFINLMLGVIPAYDWQVHAASYLISYALWKTTLHIRGLRESRTSAPRTRRD